MIKATIKTIHTILKGSYNHLSPNYTTMLLFLLSCSLKSIVNPKLHQSHLILWRKFLGKHKWRPQFDSWKQSVMTLSNKHFLSPSCVYMRAHTHTLKNSINVNYANMACQGAQSKIGCMYLDRLLVLSSQHYFIVIPPFYWHGSIFHYTSIIF